MGKKKKQKLEYEPEAEEEVRAGCPHSLGWRSGRHSASRRLHAAVMHARCHACQQPTPFTYPPSLGPSRHLWPQVAELEAFLFGGAAGVLKDVNHDEEEEEIDLAAGAEVGGVGGWGGAGDAHAVGCSVRLPCALTCCYVPTFVTMCCHALYVLHVLPYGLSACHSPES